MKKIGRKISFLYIIIFYFNREIKVKHQEVIKVISKICQKNKNHKSVENLWNDFLKDNPNNKIK
mgnify:CR=1 FL=1